MGTVCRPGFDVCFTFDVTPDRSRSAIGVAGKRPDGLTHIELVEHKRGTGWVAPRMAELLSKHETVGVVCDGVGPAASLLGAMDDHDIEVDVLTAREYGQACGRFYDAVTEKTLRHLGDNALEMAVRGAAKRPLGDAWAWSRKTSSVDISPLVAVTLALFGVSDEAAEPLVAMVAR